MKRLIEKGLMFGGLVPVEGALVERYRRALKHLTGKDTALPDFHVDISGYSPEVGDELGDDLYLNHEGVNRQFILLTTDQKRAPLLNASFSTSRGILRQFIEANEAELFALTARDAVAGELIGSVYGGGGPARLLEMRRVTVEADTTTGTVATAQRLQGLIRRFTTEADAWWDDVLIAEMIGLARETGDLGRNPVALRQTAFAQGDFWTALSGGMYVFRDVPHPGVIAVGDKGALGALPLEVMSFADRTAIARFLDRNALAEPVVQARGVDAAAILHQKMDFILADALGGRGEALAGMSRARLRALGRRHAGDLPPEWEGLAALAAWAEEGADWPRITSDHPAYFYTLRARAGPDADLVNMALAELSPLDVRQLFICHKPAFYAAYRTWPDAKKDFAVDMLAREYMVDKAGTRAALFGAEDAMEEPVVPSGPWGDGAPRARAASADLVERVGPWGAVRRR